MKIILAILFTLTFLNKTSAQKHTSMIGEYYLSGVMETASGFKLNSDSTFEFFYSYGAMDRFGRGKWMVQDSELIFNSNPWPGKNFSLTVHKKVPGNFITIKLVDENKMILRYMDCTIETTGNSKPLSTNEEGIARFDKSEIHAIKLLFRLCPERSSVFPIRDKDENYFEFSLQPWIAEVFFENFILKIEKDMLTGKHPLLQGKNYQFRKN